MKLLNYNFFEKSMDELIKTILASISQSKNCFVITPNPEFLGLSFLDKKMQTVLASASILIADGTSLLWVAKLLGKKISYRLTGIDTAINLFKQQKTLKYYFFGSTEENIKLAVDNVSQNYINAQVVGYRNGYFKSDEVDKIIDDIKAKNPDVLLVGLGMPKQEYFVYDNLAKLKVPVKLCIGGTFDVLSGKLNRAPFWMQKLGFEWLYRLIKEPFRIKRMMKIPYYLMKIFIEEKKHA